MCSESLEKPLELILQRQGLLCFVEGAYEIRRFTSWALCSKQSVNGKDTQMEDTTQSKVIEFLRDSVTHLENRINLVDNKADILLAVQGVLIGSLTYAVNEIFITHQSSTINTVSYIFLAVSFFLFTVVALLLLQTIRPSRKFFGLNVPFTEMQINNYVMWPKHNFPSAPENYISTLEGFNDSSIRQNYFKLHFTTLQLVRNKYRPYRWATLAMKISVVWIFLGVIVLSLLKMNVS